MAVQNASITASTLIGLIPTSVTGFNLEVDGIYSTKETRAHLRNLSFQTKNPSLDVKELSTWFKMDKMGIGVENLILRTSASNIFINGNYSALDSLHANIEANPVDKHELAIFVPTFKLTCSPEIKTQVQTKNDTTNAQIELKNGNQSILARVQFHSFKKALDDKKVKAPYLADITFNNVNSLEQFINPK